MPASPRTTAGVSGDLLLLVLKLPGEDTVDEEVDDEHFDGDNGDDNVKEYLDQEEEEEEEEEEDVSKSYDPGALLAISLTTITTTTFNVMLGGLVAHHNIVIIGYEQTYSFCRTYC